MIVSAIVVILVCVAPAKPATLRHHGYPAWWKPDLASPAKLSEPAAHSPYTPDPVAARYWSHRAFGPRWQQGLCISYTESRDELSPPSNGSSWGPWQILKTPTIHTWLNVWKVTHSWKYAAYATRRVAWHPPQDGQPGYYDLSPWHPDCGA